MDTSDFIIKRATSYSPELLEAVRHLVKQIGSSFQELTADELRGLLASPQSYLFVAQNTSTQEIVGMVMAVLYRIPYAKKAYFDDLIVDEKFRKMGIATKLMQKAIQTARGEKVSYIEFTAHPKRIASNHLYEKLGFQKRETNIYRLSLHNEEA